MKMSVSTASSPACARLLCLRGNRRQVLNAVGVLSGLLLEVSRQRLHAALHVRSGGGACLHEEHSVALHVTEAEIVTRTAFH